MACLVSSIRNSESTIGEGRCVGVGGKNKKEGVPGKLWVKVSQMLGPLPSS